METLSASEAGRVIIVGAGHNGLVAAFHLAQAGYAPLVLERREVVGGIAVTEEIHPGFRCPTITHATGPLLRDVAALTRRAQGALPSPGGRGIIALHPDGR